MSAVEVKTYNPVIVTYADYAYRDRPLYFIKMCLSKEEKFVLIERLSTWYWNTDQDADEYALELAVVVSMIMHDGVILNPRYIDMNEALGDFLLLFNNRNARSYKKYFEMVQEGFVPGKEGMGQWEI